MKRALALVLAMLAARGEAEPGDGFDVTRYRVALTPDYAARAINGRAAIELDVTASELRELVFTPNRLVIAEARLNGRPVQVAQRPDGLAFTPSAPLRRGAHVRLDLHYAGTEVRGLTFGAQSAYSNWFSCDWMICLLDRPGDKAWIELALTVPAGQTTLGPGALVQQRTNAGGTETHVWRSERPYSSFLYSFATGPWARWEGRAGATRLQVLSETAAPERLGQLFAPTADMLRFFSSHAGVPFPHRTYTQLHVAGGAAQEAAGFAIIGEEGIAPILATPSEDWVIAHELGHQWWGNLITCADWTQFWLNEGLTTFMVAAWKEQRWGRAAYDREMEIARRRYQRAIDANLDVPLTYAGAYPSLSLRRAITYSKGALFLDALRTELGDAAFWRGLRLYTRRHAGGVVTSRDFQRAFEQASGRDLAAIFNRWVYGPQPA